MADSASAQARLDEAARPEQAPLAEAAEFARVLRQPDWLQRAPAAERRAVMRVPSMERRRGRMASPALATAPVEWQEPLSRSEPGQVVAPQRASALAGAVHSATVRAAAWLALALPAPV
jgi:hypothetical protein